MLFQCLYSSFASGSVNKRLQSNNERDSCPTGYSMINDFCELSLFDLTKIDTAQNYGFNTILRLEIFTSQHPSSWRSFYDTKSKISLLIAHHVIMNSSQDKNAIDSIIRLLDEIAHLDMVSKDHRAQAFYLIGHYYLEKARDHGDLHTLWEEPLSHSYAIHETFDTPRSCKPSSLLEKARTYFQNAASLSFPASNLLCRESLRCLALSIGPVSFAEFGSAGEMIHTSIGSTARQTISRLDVSSNENEFEESDSIFCAYDINISDIHKRKKELKRMYEEGNRIVPQDWNFVAMTLVPTGELLISSCQFNDDDPMSDCNFKYRTACVFPSSPNKFYENSEFMSIILKPFDDLMDRSKKQLNDVDQDKFQMYNNSRDAKLNWWSVRDDLDHRLQELLKHTQHLYFDADRVKEILLQTNVMSGDVSFSVGNLAARFEAACTMDDDFTTTMTQKRHDSRESLQILTVKQLKERLEEFEVRSKDVRSLRKAELIDLLSEKLDSKQEKVETIELDDSINSSSHTENLCINSQQCTFLILDEHLCRFPFEGLPLLRGRTVCRVPSVPFAISSLSNVQSENYGRTVDPALTKFILDPESNLPGTQKRLNETLTNISETYNYQWDGIVGSIPSEQFMRSALLQENGMFLYFGHNGGERCFSKAQIESLIKSQNDEPHRNCKASIILMGCSSGVLLSVNQNNGSDMCNKELNFEPEGVALSYLCAGAPCVVSNLWDVTDRDIDRYVQDNPI